MRHVYSSTRSRQDIGENSQTPTFHHKIRIKIVVSIKAKIGEDLAEDPTSRTMLVSVPNSPPIKRYRQKNTIAIHNTNDYVFLVSLWFRVQICEFRSANLTSYSYEYFQHIPYSTVDFLLSFFTPLIQWLNKYFRIHSYLCKKLSKRKRKNLQ